VFGLVRGQEQIACHCVKNRLQALRALGFGKCGDDVEAGGVLISQQGDALQLLLQQQRKDNKSPYSLMEYININ
jgi:hypothetical protein